MGVPRGTTVNLNSTMYGDCVGNEHFFEKHHLNSVQESR